MSAELEHTSVSARRPTIERFKEAKPHDSLSHDAFINLLLDAYEEGDD